MVSAPAGDRKSMRPSGVDNSSFRVIITMATIFTLQRIATAHAIALGRRPGGSSGSLSRFLRMHRLSSNHSSHLVRIRIDECGDEGEETVTVSIHTLNIPA